MTLHGVPCSSGGGSGADFAQGSHVVVGAAAVVTLHGGGSGGDFAQRPYVEVEAAKVTALRP